MDILDKLFENNESIENKNDSELTCCGEKKFYKDEIVRFFERS